MDSKPAPVNTNRRIYPPLAGANYLVGLRALHAAVQPETYFEIGSFTGHSLILSKCRTVAVDPDFKLTAGSIAGKKELHLFGMTSDDFFAEGHLGKVFSSLDMAFLDGMHLFEFLLRDFMNTEKHCTKDSVVIMHDCIPMNPAASERHWNKEVTMAWTGDVWKLVPILKKYRPDLDVSVLDYPPSGLTVVQNLDPNSTILDEHYDEIVKDFMDETIDSFGKDKLYELLDVQLSDETDLFEKLANR